MGIDWIYVLKLAGLGFAIVLGVLTMLFVSIGITGVVVRKLSSGGESSTVTK